MNLWGVIETSAIYNRATKLRMVTDFYKIHNCGIVILILCNPASLQCFILIFTQRRSTDQKSQHVWQTTSALGFTSDLHLSEATLKMFNSDIQSLYFHEHCCYAESIQRTASESEQPFYEATITVSTATKRNLSYTNRRFHSNTVSWLLIGLLLVNHYMYWFCFQYLKLTSGFLCPIRHLLLPDG